jgi:hypothetical protein
MEKGSKVIITQRKPHNKTGIVNFSKPNGDVGTVGFIDKIGGGRREGGSYCVCKLGTNEYLGWFDNEEIELYIELPIKKVEDKPVLIQGIYNIGDVVVSLEKVDLRRNLGDMFKVSSKSNGNILYYNEFSCSSEIKSFRKATQEEEKAFNNGITNISDIKTVDMAEIQKEAMRRYSISTQYRCATGNYKDVRMLKNDQYTYRIEGNYILAHSGGGLLYRDGVWAEILSIPIVTKNLDEYPIGSYCYRNGWVFKKVNTINYECNNYALHTVAKDYYNGNAHIQHYNKNPDRLATDEEREWLDACISAGKFVENPKTTQSSVLDSVGSVVFECKTVIDSTWVIEETNDDELVFKPVYVAPIE